MAATFSSLSDDLRSPLLTPPANNKTEKICIDEMLQKYCGEFGKWQLKHFVLTSLAWALEAFHTMVIIFADREPDWKCVSGTECSAGANVCGLSSESWEWIGGKAASTVSEWSLICGDKFKVGLVQAAFFAGCMIDGFGGLNKGPRGSDNSDDKNVKNLAPVTLLLKGQDLPIKSDDNKEVHPVPNQLQYNGEDLSEMMQSSMSSNLTARMIFIKV